MAFHSRVTRDANHPGIVKDLKALGYSVGDMASVGGSFPDIIVADHTVTAIIELKLPSGKFSLKQLLFLANWRGVAGFAETTDECVRLLTDPVTYSLTTMEKQIIFNIVVDAMAASAVKKAKTKNPQMRVTQFDKQFAAAGGRVF